MGTEKLVLGAADYSILGLTLVVSALIGLYFQITSRKKTNEEFLYAGKSMSVIPVAFSVMATFLSATSLMGIPADMYLYGTHMAFMNIGFVVGPIIIAYVFLPVFINNNVATSYEYLEKRFGKVIRRIMSAFYSTSMILFTAATLYAPALAMSAVTNLSLWLSIISVGLVSTFYCTLGGMKAVLWADAFQAVLMFVALIAIAIKGCMDLGGVSNVFNIAKEGGRLVVPEFSFDLAAHYTFFNVLFQGFIIGTYHYGGGQMQIQRLLTLESLKKSQIACLASIPLVVAFQLMCCFSGLIFYAYFLTCDPLSSPDKPIFAPDQLMPFYITSAMGAFPGLPGICVAGIFSASLSTVSSAVNCLASVTSEDFLKPILPNLSKSVLFTKILSLLYGIVCIGLSFLLASLGNLVRMAVLLVGMFAGPCLGIFILAICTTVTNEQGAVFGVLSGLLVAACLSFIPDKKFDPPLPLSNECPDATHLNSSSEVIVTSNQTVSDSDGLSKGEKDFHLAYMWISSIAFLTCVISGYIVSLLIRCNAKGKVEKVPDAYLSPVKVWISNKIRKKQVKEGKASEEMHKCTRF